MPATCIQSIPWETIHREHFLQEDQCWTTCNGGFCCSNNHPDFQFQLIPTQGTTLLYMEDEYRWLVENRAVLDPHTPDGAPNLLSIDFGGPRPLSLVQTTCRLLGKCQGVIDKPLLCKLYPMLPVLGIDGSLEDIVASSIFELTMQLFDFRTPCTVVDKKQHYLARWKGQPERLQSLRHPYIIFYLQAAKHFTAIYSDKLMSNQALRGLRGPLFWKMWEMEYLMGELVDGDLLGERIGRTYEELVARYGSFLPCQSC